MHAKYFGFILVIWFPGLVHAQSTAEPCPIPRLEYGYFVPVQDTYPDKYQLFYSCDEEHKPVVEGWWATSTCQNGTWDHYPQCIDVKGCLPLTILNSKNTKSSNNWYSHRYVMGVNCEEHYELKNSDSTVECIDGVWNNVPVCERTSGACSEPPKIPHAVIIDQEYQEFYAKDASIEYKCEDGYTAEEENQISLCRNGNWTVGPTCSKKTKPDGGHGGSLDVGTGQSHITSGDRMTQPSGHRPDGERGGSSPVGTGGTTSGGRVTHPADGGHRPDGGHDGSQAVGTGGRDTTSGGHVRQPAGGGSSTTGGSTPLHIPVTNCGVHPIVQHGDIVEQGEMYLKYKCAAFYTLVGTETVNCFSDGTWSQLPTCKDSFCVMTAGNYGDFHLSADEYLKEGEAKYITCRWNHFTYARCINGKITHTRCCHSQNFHYYCRETQERG